MSPAVIHDAPALTARFDDTRIVAATAWQDAPPRPQNWRTCRSKQLLPTAVSVITKFPAIYEDWAELTSAVNFASSDFEQAPPSLDSDEVAVPEEGVYAPLRPRRVLFSETVEIQTDKLPRRKPRIPVDDSFLAVLGDD